MARDRQSRREREAAEDRTQRLIYFGSAAVLAVALIVVAVGIFWTRYLPPRAHVLTVDERSYNASDVVARANYLLTFQGGSTDLLGDIASEAVDRLIAEETLRQMGPELVGPVTQAQIDARVQQLLGFDPEETTFTPIPGLEGSPTPTGEGDAMDGAAGDDGDADGEPEPTAEPTPEPTPELFPLPPAAPRALSEEEEESFARELRTVLTVSGLSREQFELIAEAQVVRQLLNRHFEGDVGLAGEQVRLSRITVSSPAEANALRDRALAGEDFDALFREAQPDQAASLGTDVIAGDLGWFPRDLIPDEIATAIEGLEPGGVSEVVDRGLAFELFLVSEVDMARPWEAAARQLLVSDRVDLWETTARLALEVDIDLSSGEETWIIERVVSHVTEQLAAGAGGGTHGGP